MGVAKGEGSVPNRHFKVSRRNVMAAATALPFLAWLNESDSTQPSAGAAVDAPAAKALGASDVLNVRDFEPLARSEERRVGKEC